jgi:hypothetical protein
MIFQRLDDILKGPQFRRTDSESVDRAIDALTANQCESLRRFFRHFRGPIGSDVIGYQLLDILEDTPSIVTATNAVRKQFNLGSQWIVISDLFANSALLYNAEEDQVYDVDFEDGIQSLIRGNLQPRWSSFRAFLGEFFAAD